ncbi:MAG: sulfite exporter TauE/SafE family protein [Syntrophobacteraceae bacterium]|nr:sulfite exporter TauE/SafE family protein [Syntrophobacteraceae bacterium]
MEWMYILMPIAGVKIFWPGLIVLGIGVGIIGGFFGMGGAWMVTPGLNILGFPMAFAIGTDIAHMAGKSLISTMRHGKFGNVDYKLGVIMIIGTVAGFEVGAQMIMWLERMGSVEKVVRYMYLVLLFLISWMVFADVAKKKKKDREALATTGQVDKLSTGLEWHKTFHKIKTSPRAGWPASSASAAVSSACPPSSTSWAVRPTWR